MIETKILEILQAEEQAIFEMSDAIWEYAEVRFDTPQSESLYEKYLKAQGFHYQNNVASLRHAFCASYGSEGPCIGLLAEYDALDGLGGGSSVYQPVPSSKAGHACGHNLLGTGALMAAVVLKQLIAEGYIKARICLFGCPAEESGYGKAIMANHQVFKACDFALTWHPHYINALWTGKTLAVKQASFEFKGLASHAALSPHLGRSALDACELMNIGVNYLREHIENEERIHYAYVNAGGEAANVVSAQASTYYFVRARNQEKVEALYDRVMKVAQGAAMMTETHLNVVEDGMCKDLNVNEVLSNIMYEQFLALGPLQYDAKDQEHLSHYGDHAIPSQAIEKPRYNEQDYVSTDVGDVSWQVPVAQAFIACEPNGCPMHSWQWVDNGTSDVAHKGIRHAAQLLTMTALEAIKPENLANIKQCFNTKKPVQ